MKDTVLYMLGLAATATDGPLHFWYVSLGVSLTAAVALWRFLRGNAAVSRGMKLAFVSVVTFPLVFLALGSVFAVDLHAGTTPQDTIAPLRILGASGVIFLVACCASILLAARQRLVAAAVTLVGVWIGFWSYAVAASSISGLWP